jgi:phosphoribosylamine--glycine ligase
MAATDVLVVGSGGREHALCWKLAQSLRVGKLYCAPGNGGTQRVAEHVAIGALEFEKLADFAEEKNIGLTVVGPDDAFVGGIVDVFTKRGLRIWGPTKAAAQIEGSKAFSKQLMQKAGIPTAEFGVFTDYDQALAYVRKKGVPIVVKASGLALGKGVYVCQSNDEAETALKEIMLDNRFGDSGSEVVIEEFLDGPEISIHALSDGNTHALFPPTQDHKRALEGDRGPNTGGMGVIGPLPWVSGADMRTIDETIVTPTLAAMKEGSAAFSGLLYPGLKLTSAGPKVLEYNARFGDPETQVYMRLLSSDLFDLLDASVDGTLASHSLAWSKGFACNIVLASGGYPESYQKGFPITGIEEAEKMPGIVVFHAGTKLADGKVVTNGGRVLVVSATGNTLQEALERAYAAADLIQFEGKYLRRDIGAKAR